MPDGKKSKQFSFLVRLVRTSLLILPVSVFAGSVVAFFLWLLDAAINFRYAHTWLLFFLPFAGVVIYFMYRFFGRDSEAGTNLILKEIHEPGGGLSIRMAPLVLVSTIVTHLFGGSAGREGTAVQIGGSLAHWLADKLKLNNHELQMLLMSGVAAGFGAVFGTPVTGAIFALEVIAIGAFKYNFFLPCLLASLLADVVCRSWGIVHTAYSINHSAIFDLDLLLLAKVILAGILFGFASLLFTHTSHFIKVYAEKLIKIKWLIPVFGGILILCLSFIPGNQDYLGLGVYNPDVRAVSIVSCFHPGGAHLFSWIWKIVFTAITLGTGFKGGEVTPLFFIGAALGNTIAFYSGTPVDLMAGLGFIAVFAGAANTPVACTILGIELFGIENAVYFAAACFAAYYFSGQKGIYQSGRKNNFKLF